MVVFGAITGILLRLAVGFSQFVLVKQLVEVVERSVARARPISLEFFEAAIDQRLVESGLIAVDRIVHHLQNFGQVLLVSFGQALAVHGVLRIQVVLIQNELLPPSALLYPVHHRGVMLFDARYHLIRVFFMNLGRGRNWGSVINSLVEERVLEQKRDSDFLRFLQLALAQDGVQARALAHDFVGTQRVLDLAHEA